MKKHIPTIMVIVIFLCGLSLFLYPTISNLYNQHLSEQLIGEYKEAFEDIKPQRHKKEKENAEQFNKYRNNPQKLKELGLSYEEVLNVVDNGVMGYIEIPKISVSLVIYHTIEEDKLQSGIGHVESSSLPIGGESTHCVLAGHTGLPSAKLLTNIDHLKVGDYFYLHVLDEVLAYKIDDVVVVEPHEVNRLNVISGKDHVTLVTCTPYGVNSHRLLVRGERVDMSKGEHISSDNVQNDITNISMKNLLTFSLIGLFILFIAVRKIIKMRKNKKKRGIAVEEKP